MIVQLGAGLAALVAITAAGCENNQGNNDQIFDFDPPSPARTCPETLQFISDEFGNKEYIVKDPFIIFPAAYYNPENRIDFGIGILTDDKETFLKYQQAAEKEITYWFIRVGFDHVRVSYNPMKITKDQNGKDVLQVVEIPGIGEGMVTGTSCVTEE